MKENHLKKNEEVEMLTDYQRLNLAETMIIRGGMNLDMSARLCGYSLAAVIEAVKTFAPFKRQEDLYINLREDTKKLHILRWIFANNPTTRKEIYEAADNAHLDRPSISTSIIWLHENEIIPKTYLNYIRTKDGRHYRHKSGQISIDDMRTIYIGLLEGMRIEEIAEEIDHTAKSVEELLASEKYKSFVEKEEGDVTTKTTEMKADQEVLTEEVVNTDTQKKEGLQEQYDVLKNARDKLVAQVNEMNKELEKLEKKMTIQKQLDELESQRANLMAELENI